jgi:23S rRNA pseudouridine2604 synthase
VTVNKPLHPSFVQKMSTGIPILGTITAPCTVVLINRFKFRIILTQGLNRQIRRMCAHLGYQVTQLKRIRIMHIQLDLAVGKWRDLSEKELTQLTLLIQDSSKTT